MRSTLGFGTIAAVCSFMGMVAVACGGASGSDVFTGDGGATDDASPVDGASTSGDGATSGTDGSGTPPTPTDGGTSADGGPGGNTTSMTCGSATCSIPAQTCCVARTSTSAFNFSCVNGASCPVQDAGAGTTTRPTSLQCTSSANCATGEVCCVSLTPSGAAASCKAAGACASGGGGGGDTAVLCDPTQPTVGCPSTQPCSSNNISDWRLPSGFGTCGGKGN